MSARRRGRVAALGVICAAVGTATASCGGGDIEVSPAPAQTTATAPAEKPLAGRTQAARRLTITVTDDSAGRFRYRAPRTVAAGLVEIRLRNRTAVPRKAQLWRISGEHTTAQARRIQRPLPDWLRSAGGVSRTEPGATGTTVQRLDPGRYYVAGTGGERGTVAELRVTGDAAQPALPGATARLETFEFGFRSAGLKAGRRAVEFRNIGSEPHHVFFAPIEAGASLGDVRRFFNATNYTGAPPVSDSGTRDTVVLEGGDRQVTELDLRPGRYALLCFVRNRAGGQPHNKLGMLDELRVR